MRTGRNEDGSIQILRGKWRAHLAEMGLFGKVELTSAMSSEDVKSEICQIFMVAMGLTADGISNKRFSDQLLTAHRIVSSFSI